MTKKQEQFKKALKKANNILDEYIGRKGVTARVNAYPIIEAKTGMRFNVKLNSQLNPPWHTFVWVEPKADASEMEIKRDEHGTEVFVKHCIDCGEEFETVNEARTSCDVCHQIRCDNKGYKELNLRPDGLSVELGPKAKTYYRK